MIKNLMKFIFRRYVLFSKAIIRLEKWVREDIYSSLQSEKYLEFLDLLSVDNLTGMKLVRKGSAHDGGYLFADLGRNYSKLISFGVGDNVDFESDISLFVDSIDLYDPTVEFLPRQIVNGVFYRIGLAEKSNDCFISLNDSVKESFLAKDLLLKIDIEGDEWDSLRVSDSELLGSFSQIFLELHDLHKIWNPEILSKYIEVLRKLRANHFLVNFHANNWSAYSVIAGVPLPDTIEITLVRKDLCSKFSVAERVGSVNLNAANNPNKPEYRTIF